MDESIGKRESGKLMEGLNSKVKLHSMKVLGRKYSLRSTCME